MAKSEYVRTDLRTDIATLDRPCIWYACLDQAAPMLLFCAHHEPEHYDDFLPEEAPD